LKNKLVAGKNEHNAGYQKFASAQFFGKLSSSLTVPLFRKPDEGVVLG
jgi:hypothetical protein